jgi:hypothetical protein
LNRPPPLFTARSCCVHHRRWPAPCEGNRSGKCRGWSQRPGRKSSFEEVSAKRSLKTGAENPRTAHRQLFSERTCRHVGACGRRYGLPAVPPGDDCSHRALFRVMRRFQVAGIFESPVFMNTISRLPISFADAQQLLRMGGAP